MVEIMKHALDYPKTILLGQKGIKTFELKTLMTMLNRATSIFTGSGYTLNNYKSYI